MAYVQLDNPEIIDLASIQKIISVLNDHSDYLNVLVTKFGADIIPDWLADEYDSTFDLASNMIAFGKRKINPGSANEEEYNGKTYYYKEVQYGNGVSFSAKPNVIVSHDNTGGSIGGQLDIIVSTHNITPTGFTIRAHRPSGTQQIENDIDINFVAIGAR